jgi:glycosyltransferase involved in cell wall biosynthesis
VQIVGPIDHWILERLARRLAAKLPYTTFEPWAPEPTQAGGLVYFVNHALYQGPTGSLDVGFITHKDDAHQLLYCARQLDFCVCMARQYAEWLQSQGVTTVAHIPMGCDYYRYRSRLVLGVMSRLAHPRKGRRLVEHLRQLPFVEMVTTEGDLAEEQLGKVYQRLDYVLIPATIEGGPLSLLEGLALGKPVIAPDSVGIVPEFGPTPHVRRYPTGDAKALAQVVTECYAEKRQRTRLVQDRTWDRWAEAHHHLFLRLGKERGIAIPEPAPGFRFGLLGELDEVELPWGNAVEPLEMAVDQAAAQLFFGQYHQARAVLEAVRAQYPCVHRLLDSIPAGHS